MTKGNRKSLRQFTLRSPVEIILASKKTALMAAEREYWAEQTELRRQLDVLIVPDLQSAVPHPDELGKLVWALRDGVALVRYHHEGVRPDLQFRIADMSVDEWGARGLIVPVQGGELSLAQAGVLSGTGPFTLVHCAVNGVEIPYAEFQTLSYSQMTPDAALTRAVLDFQLFVAGLYAHQQATANGSLAPVVKPEMALAALDALAVEFEALLDAAGKEELLQTFVKEHPIVLHPSAVLIPKQKLGEDFVTDFVMAEVDTQGTVYTLVELERASHVILNQDGSLSSATNHAVMQTLQWDIWLEQDKAHLQRKLPGFETPCYLIIIGRSHEFSDTQKAFMRAHNRRQQNARILSYDDVLVGFRQRVERLRAHISPSGSGDA